MIFAGRHTISAKVILGVLASAAAVPALAQNRDDELPKAFADVVACRDVPDAAGRLACFDAATAALEKAEADKEIVVVSGDEVRKTRRGLFGLKLPQIFAAADDKEEFSQLEATIAEVRGGRGGYSFVLDDGAVWTKTDDGYLRKPTAGQTILIKQGALGSFWGRIEGGASFRIKRVN